MTTVPSAPVLVLVMQTAVSVCTESEEEECLSEFLAAPLTDDQNKA